MPPADRCAVHHPVVPFKPGFIARPGEWNPDFSCCIDSDRASAGGNSLHRWFPTRLARTAVPVLDGATRDSGGCGLFLVRIAARSAGNGGGSLNDADHVSDHCRYGAVLRTDCCAGGASACYKKTHGKESDQVSQHLRGRTLFQEDITWEYLRKRFRNGIKTEVTALTEEFSFEHFNRQTQGRAIPMFLLTADHDLLVFAKDYSPKPSAGQTLISLVDS